MTGSQDTFVLMRAGFERLLSEVAIVWVSLTDHPRLEVPEHVRPGTGEITTFEYGLDLPVPIADLEITDAGIKATLSFSRVPCHTFVPWEAIVGIASVVCDRGAPVSPKPGTRPKFSLVP